MSLIAIKNKIFPLIVLLLAITINSFPGSKGGIADNRILISAKSSTPVPGKQTEAETPQNTGEQENDDKDDKVEDADDLFIFEIASTSLTNHQINHIHDFQIALYRDHHTVIFSPPPEIIHSHI
mgnify:CR=1 FL=1